MIIMTIIGILIINFNIIIIITITIRLTHKYLHGSAFGMKL